jgi:signal transduction histidine kinase
MHKLCSVIGLLWIGLYAQLSLGAAHHNAHSTRGATDVIALHGDTANRLQLTGRLQHLTVLQDNSATPQRNIDAAQVLSGALDARFEQFNAPNIGYADSGWFRFSIDNVSAERRDLLLVFDNILFLSIELYYQRAAQWQQLRAGLRFPWAERPQSYRYYAFPLPLEPGANTIYFKVSAASDTFFAPYLVDDRGLIGVASVEAGRSNLIVGIVIGIAAYLLVLSLVARDWSSATWYCLGAMFVSVTILAFMNGELGPLLPNSPRWHTYAGRVTTNLEMLLLLQFTRHAFQTWRCDYWIDRGLRLLCYIQIGLIIATPWLDAVVAEPTVLAAAVSVEALIALALYFAWRRRPSANYYLLGMLAFAFFNALFVLGRSGVLAADAWVLHGYELSFCFQSAAFAMMLTDKLSQVRRERALAEIKAANAQADSNAKSDFLAVMSHEIRTPLNGVLGMAELLDDTPLNKTQHYYVQTIYNSGKALLRVLSNILDYSKVEAGKMELEQRLFNIGELVAATIAPYRDSAASRGIALLTQIAPDMPVWLLGDTTRLRQVLNNLLDNAFKFTQQGAVTVCIEPGRRNQNRLELYCSVRDTGPGIAAELQPRLFQSFAQADASSTRKFGGTGLGLALCKRLVTLMEGHIDASSEAGAGAVFRFSVWLQIGTAPASTAEAAA